jgi:hypothetical protein
MKLLPILAVLLASTTSNFTSAHAIDVFEDFAVLLSLSTGTLNARDADFASRTFAAAHTAKRKCLNTCRARYRDCLSLKQIPSSECRGIYQDCIRYTCNAGPVGRPSWPGFPGEP